MDIGSKATAYTENSDKAYFSSMLADLIYDKVEKNQVLRIKTIQQDLNKLEVRGKQELDEEQEKIPMKHC